MNLYSNHHGDLHPRVPATLPVAGPSSACSKARLSAWLSPATKTPQPASLRTVYSPSPAGTARPFWRCGASQTQSTRSPILGVNMGRGGFPHETSPEEGSLPSNGRWGRGLDRKRAMMLSVTLCICSASRQKTAQRRVGQPRGEAGPVRLKTFMHGATNRLRGPNGPDPATPTGSTA